jgi:hypothetical protein
MYSEIKRLEKMIASLNIVQANIRDLLLMKLEYAALFIVANEKYGVTDNENSVLTKAESYKSLSQFWNNLLLSAESAGGNHNLKLCVVYAEEALWCIRASTKILEEGISALENKKNKADI